MKDFRGYVIYAFTEGKEQPCGVISENHECKATSNYYPSTIKNYLIQIEDRRFLRHSGVDCRAIVRAFVENVKAGKIVQGGSTISQQLARNTLKSSKRTFVRKIRETITALQYEQRYTKDEILNLYFDNVYFGKNIRGFRAAGLYYFGKEIKLLSQSEWLFLLTILRGPNYYIRNPRFSKRRFDFLSSELLNNNLISKTRHLKNINSRLTFKNKKNSIVREAAVPFITTRVDEKGKRLFSTIDIGLQSSIDNYIAKSKYPVSVIALRKEKVVGFGSSYGSDYPFISRTNVGSTLKPFLYCHLRENGIAASDEFHAFTNDLFWQVREVEYIKSRLNLEEALLRSNNNVFINSANKAGIPNALAFLANTLGQSESIFFPASILGATTKGISMFELGVSYSIFFQKENLTPVKKECLKILNRIFKEKINLNIENAFLKTGTTNNNKERFAVIGDAETTFVFLRNENTVTDYSKEGGFLIELRRYMSSIFVPKKNYKWI